MSEYKGPEIVVTPKSSRENEIEAKRLAALKALYGGAYGVARFLPWIKYATDIGDVMGVTDTPDGTDILQLWAGPSGSFVEKMYDLPKADPNWSAFDQAQWERSRRIILAPVKTFSTFIQLPAIIGDMVLSTKDYLRMNAKVDDYRRAKGISDTDKKAMEHFIPLPSTVGMEGTYDVLGFKTGGQFVFPTNKLVKDLQRISGSKPDMRKKRFKSAYPTYNTNRIINRAQQGLKFGDYDYIGSLNFNVEASTPNTPWILNLEFSELNNFKDVHSIMQEVTPTANLPSQNLNLLNSISKYIGIPYKFGGKSKNGIDCSGFTSAVMQDMGVNLKGGSILQWNLTLRINLPDLKVGDLVFLKGTIKGRGKDLPSHVAIVTSTDDLLNGNIQVAEAASSTGSTVRNWNLKSGFYKDHWLGAGRIV